MIVDCVSIFATHLPSLSLSAKLNISSASSGSTGVGRSCNYCTKIDYIIFSEVTKHTEHNRKKFIKFSVSKVI